jgi:cob(I)alamin adenosyltransferase
MARPSISTATGDTGTTGLYGGRRISKASPRIQAYGDVDELNAVLGLVLVESSLPPALQTQLMEIQRTLFTLGADLATPVDTGTPVQRISANHVSILEAWGYRFEANLPPLNKFILPSGSRAGCLLHQARTICRRAERWTVQLANDEAVNEHALVYLNRLSDYLFLAARTANQAAGQPETQWIAT